MKPANAATHAAPARWITPSSGTKAPRVLNDPARRMAAKTNDVPLPALSSRPVCPSVARAITASVIEPIAPAPRAWNPAAAGTALGKKIDAATKARPTGTKAYAAWSTSTSGSRMVRSPAQRDKRHAWQVAAAAMSSPEVLLSGITVHVPSAATEMAIDATSKRSKGAGSLPGFSRTSQLRVKLGMMRRR